MATEEEVREVLASGVQDVKEQWENLMGNDREDASKLCYAVLQRKLKPEEMQKASAAAWRALPGGGIKVAWPFDEDTLLEAMTGLEVERDYRWKFYPVGSKTASFPAVKSPINGKSFQIDEDTLPLGSPGINPFAAGGLAKGVVDADVVRAMMDRDREKERIHDNRIDKMLAWNHKFMDQMATMSVTMMGRADTIAEEGRYAKKLASEHEGRIEKRLRIAEVHEMSAERILAEAQELAEKGATGGLAGFILSMLDSDGGKEMLGEVVGALGMWAASKGAETVAAETTTKAIASASAADERVAATTKALMEG